MNPYVHVLASYIFTGIALTIYDFSAPPLHAKGYVNSRNFNVAFISWFTWPLSLAFDAYQEHRLQRSATRYVIGALLMFVGLFLGFRALFRVSLMIVDWHPLAYVAAFAGTLFLCPVFASIAMPRYKTASRGIDLLDL